MCPRWLDILRRVSQKEANVNTALTSGGSAIYEREQIDHLLFSCSEWCRGTDGFVVLTVASFKDEVVVDSPLNYPKSL